MNRHFYNTDSSWAFSCMREIARNILSDPLTGALITCKEFLITILMCFRISIFIVFQSCFMRMWARKSNVTHLVCKCSGLSSRGSPAELKCRTNTNAVPSLEGLYSAPSQMIRLTLPPLKYFSSERINSLESNPLGSANFLYFRIQIYSESC